MRFCRHFSLFGALGVLVTLLGSCASLGTTETSRLDLVKQRGELFCGVSGKIPGFSFLSPEGTYTGLDVDICRAILHECSQLSWMVVRSRLC